jgi:hypothetical protein
MQVNKIKFHHQPFGSGACGKFAIQNALLFMGIETTQDVLDRLTESSKYMTAKYGIDQMQIRDALRALKLNPKFHRFVNKIDKAKSKLDKVLKRSPVIMSAYQGQHWNVIGKKSGNYYYIADSDRKPVFIKKTWNQLIKEIVQDESDIYFIQVN